MGASGCVIGVLGAGVGLVVVVGVEVAVGLVAVFVVVCCVV